MAPNSRIRARRLVAAMVLGIGLAPVSSFSQQRATPPDARAGTDRALPSQPAPAPANRASVADAATTAAPAAALPYELRGVVSRYPVTLYTMRSCTACDAGRALLRQRGIPYVERLVADGDGELLQRLTGGRELPALTIGSQSLRGFAAEQWTAYLDVAGYPRQSRLPPTYPSAQPVPLGGSAASPSRIAEPPTDSSPPPAAPAIRSDPPPSSAPSGIRF